LLASARILRQIVSSSNSSTDVLTSQHHTILSQATDCESLIQQLIAPPKTKSATSSSSSGEEWNKLSERHDGKHSSMIYYKIVNSTNLMTRIETPIPPSLLVPLLSVLNETELYSTWLPYYKKQFHLGVSSSNKLQQQNRVSQVIKVEVDVPWPFAKREVVIDAVALDDIEETGRIALRMVTPKSDGDIVPYPKKGVLRQEFEGGFLFLKCPSDHPSLVDKNGKRGEGEDKILVYFFMSIDDKKLHLFPQAIINFVTRIVIGKAWDMFLHVAEEIKDGKRPDHSAAIEEKKEVLYNWVDERIDAMFERMKSAE